MLKPLIYCLVLATAQLAQAAPPTEDAIKSAFEDAKAKHKEEVVRLAKLGAQRKLSQEQIAKLREMRAAKSVMPNVIYKAGSIGKLNGAIFRSAIDADSSEIGISVERPSADGNRIVMRYETVPAVLVGFPNDKLTPGDSISATVYVERFEGTDAVYRAIDLAPYAEKYGKIK